MLGRGRFARLEMIVIGQTLSHYRITAALGAGGMGEVYRATDSKLGRDVAIKVLPAELAGDPERLARFEREAKLLASLNHPNIADVYGFESATLADGSSVRFVAMELVEGEDLAERLKRGPIPLDDARAIAKQVAEALEEAHENGIVHRDLKPANVKRTPDGKVKVLNFGLAKAETGEIPSASSASLSQSPTLAHTGTQAGVILGTAAYMSPEQTRGGVVDKRADIWAFGVVLYEMLTGERLFAEQSAVDTLSAVIRKEIDLGKLPASTPPRLREIVGRCLERDPKRRLPDIGDARLELESAATGMTASSSWGASPSAAVTRSAPNGPSTTWRWIALAVAVAVPVAFIAGRKSWQPAGPPAIESAIALPLPLGAATTRGPMAFSPDGSRLALVAVDGEGRALLHVRPLATTAARPLAGTEDASSPFWSPDGRRLGYFAHGKLWKVSLDGGAPVALAETAAPMGGAWSRDGEIVFAPGDFSHPLLAVDSRGGAVRIVADAVPGSTRDWHVRPVFLPDGQHFLFSVYDLSGTDSGVWVGSLDGAAPRRVAKEILSATFVEPGWLLSWDNGAVSARAFDPKTLALGAEVAQIAAGVAFDYPSSGLFAANADRLAFVPQGSRPTGSELVWADRADHELGTVGPRGAYFYPRLSLDGKRIAVDYTPPGAANSDIWLVDLERSTLTRFTLEDGDESHPVWSAANDAVFYYGRGRDLFRQSLRGSPKPELLLEDGAPLDASADGHWLIVRRYRGGGGDTNLFLFDLTTRRISPLLDSRYDERDGRISPDGRWLAYASDESGRFEIYLQRFPKLGYKIKVSTDGGIMPLWESDGRTLDYWSGDYVLTSVSLELGPEAKAGFPVPLFQVRLRMIGGWSAQYLATADRKRFLLNRVPEDRAERPIVLVQNWWRRMERQ